MKNRSIKEYSQKIVSYSERTRSAVLSVGYSIIERKSKMKKFFRESYLLAEGKGNYKNIPLGTIEGQTGKSHSDYSRGNYEYKNA